MGSALILSCIEKSTEFFSELLTEAEITKIVDVRSCEKGRRLLLEEDFDMVIINAPLRDESGEKFAREIAKRGIAQVILVVKSEKLDLVTAVCEDYGVLTVGKPINKLVFLSTLKHAKSTQNRIKQMQAENTKLKQKIEDIRIVDRAKWILVSHMSMEEREAHRYIEKQAMDMRSTKRFIAEGILKTYEN